MRMKLHMLLAEHRMTQKELSKATGIRQATISAYASNNYKHIVREHIDILCDYFNCDLTDLIELDKSERKPVFHNKKEINK
ncbi:helix-turn-helix transcriptional regulator [Clostridium perfringens]|uniref:helix-turn-helix domain-containing protein n=1 Tax=Clostridium perfringens TaxID=1502 RepID=UPI002FF19F9E